MESIMNPFDRQAVEAALRIKEKTNSTRQRTSPNL